MLSHIMKIPVSRIADNSLRLSDAIKQADTNGDGKLDTAEIAAEKKKLTPNVAKRLDLAVQAGNGDVKASQSALQNASVAAFGADRNRDGFIDGKELQALPKGSLERSLFNRDHGAWDKGLENRAMNAGKVLGDGLTPEQVQKFMTSQVPAERMAAQAWVDGGGTLAGAQAQLAQAIQQLDQADANGDGRVGAKEGQKLTGAALALFNATTALPGRW
jgi:hypothetical protein